MSQSTLGNPIGTGERKSETRTVSESRWLFNLRGGQIPHVQQRFVP
jgi:hypothetical protein